MKQPNSEPIDDSSRNQFLRVCKSTTRLAIRVLIIVLVTLICAYQIYKVYLLYSNYETNVRIKLDKTRNIQLPAVTVCSEIASTVKVDELYRISPSLYQIFLDKTRTEVNDFLARDKIRQHVLEGLHSLPIDQIFRHTVSAEEFFTECLLPIPGDSWNLENNQTLGQSNQVINCSQFGPIVETVSYNFKCFSLFMNSTDRKYGYDYPRDVVRNFKILTSIQVNRNYLSNGMIYVHSPDVSHQYSNTKNIHNTDPDSHQFVSYAFDRETLRLLPPPYTTQCRDYPSDGYQCRADCMTKCKVARYLQLDGGWPGDAYAERDVTARFSETWINSFSNTGALVEGVTGESMATCNEECGDWDNCESVNYDLRTVRVQARDEDNFEMVNLFSIAILPPKDVQTIIQHVPDYNLIDFVIYVGSTIHLYFGFSIMTILIGILTYFTFSSKCQTKNVCIPAAEKVQLMLDKEDKNPNLKEYKDNEDIESDKYIKKPKQNDDFICEKL